MLPLLPLLSFLLTPEASSNYAVSSEMIRKSLNVEPLDASDVETDVYGKLSSTGRGIGTNEVLPKILQSGKEFVPVLIRNRRDVGWEDEAEGFDGIVKGQYFQRKPPTSIQNRQGDEEGEDMDEDISRRPNFQNPSNPSFVHRLYPVKQRPPERFGEINPSDSEFQDGNTDESRPDESGQRSPQKTLSTNPNHPGVRSARLRRPVRPGKRLESVPDVAVPNYPLLEMEDKSDDIDESLPYAGEVAPNRMDGKGNKWWTITKDGAKPQSLPVSRGQPNRPAAHVDHLNVANSPQDPTSEANSAEGEGEGNSEVRELAPNRMDGKGNKWWSITKNGAIPRRLPVSRGQPNRPAAHVDHLNVANSPYYAIKEANTAKGDGDGNDEDHGLAPNLFDGKGGRWWTIIKKGARQQVHT